MCTDNLFPDQHGASIIHLQNVTDNTAPTWPPAGLCDLMTVTLHFVEEGDADDDVPTRCEHDHPVTESACVLCEMRHAQKLAEGRSE